MYKGIKNWILKELTLKIDFVNNDIEIGFIWLLWLFIIFVSDAIHFVIWLNSGSLL